MNDVINSCLVGVNSAGRIFCDYAAGMFVQSSVLIIVLLIIDFLLRKRVRATLRYCVWMLVFVKLVLPPTLCLPTGIGYWCGDYLSAESPVLQPVSNIVQPESARTRTPQDFAPPIEMFEPQPSRVLPEVVAPAAPTVSSIEPITWQAVLFLVWLAGVLIISILLLQRVRFVRWLIAQSSSADGQLLDLLNESRWQLGIRRNIGLRLSSNTSSPAVCGLFKPIILMPTSLVKDLSPDKLRAVFIHELAHIRRGDLWVNLAQTLLQIIYFYNPFVWLANAVVRRIREQAVDEMVLVALGPEAKNYSNTLIDIAEMAFWRASFSLRLIGVVESKKALRRRIKHMLTRPTPRCTKIGIFGLLAVIGMAAVLLPMAAATTKEEKESEPRFTATLPNGATAELAGVCEHPSKGNKWWRADGTMIEDDCRPYAFKELRILRLPLNQQENKILELAVNITDSSDKNVGIICSGANRTFINCRNNVWGGTVEVGRESEVKDFKIGVAAGAWETLASSGSRFGGRRRKSPDIVFTEAYNTQEGYAIVIVTHKKDIQKENWQVVAIDKEGELHNADLYQTQGIGQFEQDMFHFKRLKSDQIRRFEFQTRPYQWVTFTNVSLRPGHKSNVQVEVVGQAGASAKKHKVYLPDLETPRAKVVLDLATGQILSAEGIEKDRQYFEKLGKGDIVYEYASGEAGLLCLRGATVQLLTNDGPVSLKPDVQRQYFVVYFLKDVPCQYQVTTAEGDKYELQVLSVDKGDTGGAHIEYRKADGQVEVKQLGSKLENRIESLISVLRDFRVGKDKEEWFAAVRELVEAGSAAVPALTSELRRTERPQTQSVLALTLRAIGDPQAVPALIDALDKSGFSSDYGVGKADTELAKFIKKHQVDPTSKGVRLCRPVREITIALERLTGHSEGHEHFHAYDSQGNRLGSYVVTPEIRDRERAHRREVAQRWREWWQQRQKAKRLEGGILAAPEGAMLTLAIVPNVDGSELQPSLTTEEYQRHLDDLAENGPFPGALRGDSFQWSPVKGNVDRFSGMPLSTYKERTYVLLCARAQYVMIPEIEGKWTWGLEKVEAIPDRNGRPMISIQFSQKGAELFYELTKANVGNHLAICVDGWVLSAPVIELPLRKQATITGDLTDKEAQEIVIALRKGMAAAKGLQVEVEQVKQKRPVADTSILDIVGTVPNAGASLRRPPDEFSFLYPRLEKGPYILYGTVTDTDGSAAKGATVVAFRGEMWEWGLAETVTAQDGSYVFRDLPDGPYHLLAVHADAFTVQPISLGSAWQKGSTLRQDLEMEPFGSTATTGRVLDKNGKPVPDALILSCNGWGSYGRSLALQTRTSTDGRYTIRQWKSKPIIGEPLVAFAQGHDPGLLWNRVSPAPTSDIVLDDGARISGVVRFKDSGRAAVGVPVTLRRRGDLRHPKITTVTDARGAFVFDRLVPYLCALKIDNPKEGYTSAEWPELNLLMDRKVEGLELLISSGASISGTVAIKETGEPLAGIRLWIPNTRPPRVLREAITGPDGTYHLSRLPAGKFTVRCEVPPNVVREYHDPQHGSPPTDKKVSLGPDEHATGVDFSFERGVTISGCVTDMQGDPVAGARIRATNIRGGRPWRRLYTSDVETAADGTYRLSGLVPSPAWKYSVTVSAPGYGLIGSQPFQVSGDVSGKDFVLEKAAVLSGRVVDTAQAPIPFAEVRLKSMVEKEHARPVPNPVYADERGRFMFHEGAYLGMYYFEAHLVNMGFGPYSTKRADNRPIVIADSDGDREVEVIVASEDKK